MLTGSVSWGLESPCLFDDFEVAMWVGATSGALGIKEGRSISYARFVQTPLLCALDGGFLVVKPLHSIVSDPYPIRFMT